MYDYLYVYNISIFIKITYRFIISNNIFYTIETEILESERGRVQGEGGDLDRDNGGEGDLDRDNEHDESEDEVKEKPQSQRERDQYQSEVQRVGEEVKKG